MMKLLFQKRAVPKTRLKFQQGFTLMEIVIVVTLIGILTAVATPSISRWSSNLNLNKDARDILSALKSARVQAVNLNQTVTFNLDGVNKTYSLVDSNGNTLTSGNLYKNSNIINKGLGTTVQFSSKGFPTTSGSVELNNGNTHKTITLYVTGGSKIL